MADAENEILKSIITAQSMAIIDLADAVKRLNFEISGGSSSLDMNAIINKLDNHIRQTIFLTNSFLNNKRDV